MHLVFAVFDHPSRGPLLPPFDSNPLVFFSVVTIAPFVNTCIFGGMYCVFFHGSSFTILFSSHCAPCLFFDMSHAAPSFDPSSVSSVFKLLNPSAFG